jgi:DMSO/TMAO reductase YedYZ molybdopterin-dependent catalytic subunit
MQPDNQPPEGDIPEASIESVVRESRRRTRRSFMTAGAAALLGYGGWKWLGGRRDNDGIPWPLRCILELNEGFARDYFRTTRRAAEWPSGSAPQGPRVNGDIGLGSDLDVSKWKLSVSGLAAGDGTASLTLDDLRKLPLVQTTMRLCCIEGWSILVNWGGVRFVDFAKAYPPATQSGDTADPEAYPQDLPSYVGMATPDFEYYVGLDSASAVQEQTLLCYEIDGKPLTAEHGAPLRLVIPVKYGVKNIKRIGTIRWSNVRPADYWARQGYDWYAGL